MAGGSHTQTDHALMESTAKKFEAVDAELKSALDALKAKVGDLQAGWAGRGAASFQSTMDTWSRDQSAINTQLRETALLIRSSGRDYAESDDATAARFNTGGGAAPVHTGL